MPQIIKKLIENISENGVGYRYSLVCHVRPINYLVFHHTQASNVDEAKQMYEDCGVSAHFVIDLEGNIFQLVENNNIAFHAGVSYWRGKDGLNEESIGIEILSEDPEKIGFFSKQIESLILLSQDLIKKYNISPLNVVGHSDISYLKDNGYLGRKNDPSILFPWKKLAQQGVGIYHNFNLKENLTLRPKFSFFDESEEIVKIKQKLSNIGYKTDLSNKFDGNFLNLLRVFYHHFAPSFLNKNIDEKNFWYFESDNLLNSFDS